MQNENSVFFWKTNISDQSSDNSYLPVMAYVMPQKWQKIYESDLGFSRGTIFEELDKPFLGGADCD